MHSGRCQKFPEKAGIIQNLCWGQGEPEMPQCGFRFDYVGVKPLARLSFPIQSVGQR